MKRQIALLLAITVVITTGAAIGTSSNISTRTDYVPPLGTVQQDALDARIAEQDPPGVLNGEDNPDLIPDPIAFSLIFRLISDHQGETEQSHIRAYIRHLGLGRQDCKKCSSTSGEADIDALIEAANDFKQRVAVLDKQATELRSHSRERLPSAVKGELAHLQHRKDAIVAETIATLPKRLSVDGHQRLRESMEERIKSRVKMAPKTSVDSSRQQQNQTEPPPWDEPPPDDGGGYVYVDYSDQWDDSSNAEAGAGYIIGGGVTENSYDSEGDLSVVEITITSPSGRSTYSAAHGETYATTMASLAWDWYNSDDAEGFIDIDEGDWDFDIYYTRHCWYGASWAPHSYFYSGYYYTPCYFYQSRRRRRLIRRKRIVTHSYRKDFGGDYVPTCQSPCTQPIWRPILVNAPFIQCKSLYTPTTNDCSGGICLDRTTPGRCTQ